MKLKGLFGGYKDTRDKESLEWESWYEKQLAKVNNSEEIEPPWIAFPNSSPIHGWNQGLNQAWKLNVWMPFWQKLNVDERKKFLLRWKSSEEWHETLMIYWMKNYSDLLYG